MLAGGGGGASVGFRASRFSGVAVFGYWGLKGVTLNPKP